MGCYKQIASIQFKRSIFDDNDNNNGPTEKRTTNLMAKIFHFASFNLKKARWK